MAKYLRSTTTSVVLPFNAKLAKRPNIEVMTPAECSEYEAGMKTPVSKVPAPAPEPTPEPTPEPKPVFEAIPEVAVQDVSEGEPDAEDILAALDAD